LSIAGTSEMCVMRRFASARHHLDVEAFMHDGGRAGAQAAVEDHRAADEIKRQTDQPRVARL
jgi:hypothetical protein